MANNNNFEANLSKDQTNDKNAMGCVDGEGFCDLQCLSDESIALMLNKESDQLPRDDYLHRLRSGDLDANLRQEAISWVFQTWACYPFTEMWLYTALSFFDRFLSMYPIPRGNPWMIHLSAVTCLWLAAKLEDIALLSSEKLQYSWPSDYFYRAKDIEAMEVRVLECLNWKMRSYTPCNFLNYFLMKMNPGEIPLEIMIDKSFDLISAAYKGTAYLEFKPSEIAAAVSVYVSRKMCAVEIDQALSSCIQMDKDRVLTCLEMIETLPPANPPAPPTSPVTNSPPESPDYSEYSLSDIDSPSGVLSLNSDDLSDGSGTSYSSSNSSDNSSSSGSPESKRRKSDF